jgi:hypothetical protein
VYAFAEVLGGQDQVSRSEVGLLQGRLNTCAFLAEMTRACCLQHAREMVLVEEAAHDIGGTPLPHQTTTRNDVAGVAVIAKSTVGMKQS